MKKVIIYSFISFFLLAVACRKSDNVKVPELTKVPAPLLLKDTKTDQTITAQEPDLFNAKFTVGVQFPDIEQPTKMDVVIRKIGVDTLVKMFKSDITTYPTELSITGPQLKALFNNEEIVLGDKFDIGVDVTTADGKKYLAFPPVGVAYGSNVAAAAGGSPSIRYESICKFVPSAYAGNFKVLVDDFNGDFGVGSIVAVTVVNDHQLSFKSPVSGDPIIVDINVVTNEVSIAKQPYGDYKAAGKDDAWTYGVASAATISSPNNFVAPCDVILSMQIEYTVSIGTFGDYTLSMQKQ